jgi:L-threonylcarbamoyladenylate synthase
MQRVVANAKGIAEAADVIRAGGVVAIPTDTLYGLAVDPFNVEAVARVFDVKGRSADRGLPLIAAEVAQIDAHLGSLPAAARRLAQEFWPGPLTLLVRAPRSIATEVTGGTGSVGVRVPAHDAARALCRTCGVPVTATSANISNHPATNDPDVVEATLGAAIDLLLDAGRTAGGPPSTIVDVTGSALRLVRPGAIAWEEVLACAQHA